MFPGRYDCPACEDNQAWLTTIRATYRRRDMAHQPNKRRTVRKKGADSLQASSESEDDMD